MYESDKEIDLISLVTKIWNLRKNILIWGLIGLAVGVIIAISLPREYRTIVQIAPETGKDASTSMGSMNALAGMMGVNIGNTTDGIGQKLYPQIVKTTPFLLEFYDMNVEFTNPELPPRSLHDYLTKGQKIAWWNHIIGLPSQIFSTGKSDDKQKQDTVQNEYFLSSQKRNFINKLSNRIDVQNDKTTGTIIVTATMQDPLVAAIVADTLVAKLQRYMTEYRTSKSRIDLATTQKLYEEAYQKYLTAQQTYAQLKDQNKNLISEAARTRIDRAANEYNIALSIYQQLASQLEMAKLKLKEDTPIATVIEPAIVSEIAVFPKRKIITFGIGLLFIISYIGFIVVKELLKKGQTSQTGKQIDH